MVNMVNMRKQKLLSPCFVFLLLFAFSMFFFGCGDKGELKILSEEVEGRQLMEENRLNDNKKGGFSINASGSQASQVFIDDVIQLDEWMQLVKDIKSTLGEMQE